MGGFQILFVLANTLVQWFKECLQKGSSMLAWTMIGIGIACLAVALFCVWDSSREQSLLSPLVGLWAGFLAMCFSVAGLCMVIFGY